MKKALCPTLPQGLGAGYDPKIAILPYFCPNVVVVLERGPLEDTQHAQGPCPMLQLIDCM